MRYKVGVRGAAENDVAEGSDWYQGISPSLGASFLEEFGHVVQRVSETPLIYQVVYRGSRRAQMHHFPYLVWFKVEGENVTIRSCLRASIKPSTTRKRLR